MSKDDIPPLPDQVPRKRRQVESLLDVHIAMWLASDDLIVGDRKRLEVEKARRKKAAPERAVGLLVGAEGVTPAQQSKLVEILRSSQPTTVHHPGVGQRLHAACKSLDVPVYPHRVRPDDRAVSWEEAGMRELIRECNLVIAAPRDNRRDSLVWSMVRYAVHRSVAVQVVLPDGRVDNGRGGT